MERNKVESRMRLDHLECWVGWYWGRFPWERGMWAKTWRQKWEQADKGKMWERILQTERTVSAKTARWDCAWLAQEAVRLSTARLESGRKWSQFTWHKVKARSRPGLHYSQCARKSLQGSGQGRNIIRFILLQNNSWCFVRKGGLGRGKWKGSRSVMSDSLQPHGL